MYSPQNELNSLISSWSVLRQNEFVVVFILFLFFFALHFVHFSHTHRFYCSKSVNCPKNMAKGRWNWNLLLCDDIKSGPVIMHDALISSHQVIHSHSIIILIFFFFLNLFILCNFCSATISTPFLFDSKIFTMWMWIYIIELFDEICWTS